MRNAKLDECDSRLLSEAALRPLSRFRYNYAAAFNREHFNAKRVQGLIVRGALFLDSDPDRGQLVVITRAGRALLDQHKSQQAAETERLGAQEDVF